MIAPRAARGSRRGWSEFPDPGEGRRLRLRAADGFELGAVFYAARRPRTPRRVAVLHGGGGIPALRYGRFARFLAEWGIPVLTYDYRGIGLSRPAEMRRLRATIEDWAELDSTCALGWLRDRFPDDEILGLSHSIGALMLGGALNAAQQSCIVMVGPHTGYFGDYGGLYRVPMTLAWHAVMPALTRLFGYFPARRLGLGEDLPDGMALEWAARRGPDLSVCGPEPARRGQLLERCAALAAPAIAVSISDDAFATAGATKRLLTYFPRLAPTLVVFTPADAQVRRIGHFGFFRRASGATLWPRLMAQLDSAAPAPCQPAIASGSAAASSA